jgi:hypothetical protein
MNSVLRIFSLSVSYISLSNFIATDQWTPLRALYSGDAGGDSGNPRLDVFGCPNVGLDEVGTASVDWLACEEFWASGIDSDIASCACCPISRPIRRLNSSGVSS